MRGGKKSCPLCGTNPGAGEQVGPPKGNLVDIKEEASPKKERNTGFVLLKCLRRLLMRGVSHSENWERASENMASDSEYAIINSQNSMAIDGCAGLESQLSTNGLSSSRIHSAADCEPV